MLRYSRTASRRVLIGHLPAMARPGSAALRDRPGCISWWYRDGDAPVRRQSLPMRHPGAAFQWQGHGETGGYRNSVHPAPHASANYEPRNQRRRDPENRERAPWRAGIRVDCCSLAAHGSDRRRIASPISRDKGSSLRLPPLARTRKAPLFQSMSSSSRKATSLERSPRRASSSKMA